jgi:hypothetical protein
VDLNTVVQMVVQVEQPQTRVRPAVFSRTLSIEQTGEHACSKRHFIRLNELELLIQRKFLRPVFVEEVMAIS